MTYEIASTSCLHCLRRDHGKTIAGNASFAQVLSFSKRTLIIGSYEARSDNDAINLARKIERGIGRRLYTHKQWAAVLRRLERKETAA